MLCVRCDLKASQNGELLELTTTTYTERHHRHDDKVKQRTLGVNTTFISEKKSDEIWRLQKTTASGRNDSRTGSRRSSPCVSHKRTESLHSSTTSAPRPPRPQKNTSHIIRLAKWNNTRQVAAAHIQLSLRSCQLNISNTQWRSQKFSTGGASICSIPFCPFPFSCPAKSGVQSKNVMTYHTAWMIETNNDKQLRQWST